MFTESWCVDTDSPFQRNTSPEHLAIRTRTGQYGSHEPHVATALDSTNCRAHRSLQVAPGDSDNLD